MRRGDFETAWRFSDEVLRSRAGRPCWDLPRHLQWIWDGRPLDGRSVLVRCYHGLGDTLQFARYAPLLKARGCRVVFWAQAALIPLLRTIPEIDECLPLHDGSPDAACEAEIELMELPHYFRTSLATLPATVPYLHVEPDPLPGARAPIELGVVWQSGDWDPRRSVPVECLRPWARLPGVRLHALQRGPALAQWPRDLGPVWGADAPLVLAPRMRALDLVITVDSMPAHLAGALGVPVWTLLHADPDWRWLQGREDSPWYPTMRLFRQERPGEWEGVCVRVGRELADRTMGRMGRIGPRGQR